MTVVKNSPLIQNHINNSDPDPTTTSLICGLRGHAHAIRVPWKMFTVNVDLIIWCWWQLYQWSHKGDAGYSSGRESVTAQEDLWHQSLLKKDPLSSAPGPFILHFNGLRVEVPSLAMSPLCRSERTEPIRCLFGRCLDTHPNGITAFHPCRGSIWLVFVRLTLLFITSILYLAPWKKYHNLAVRGTSLLLQECGKNRPDSTAINIYNYGRAFASIVSVLSLSAVLVLSYGFAELCCHNTICMLTFSANL